jgi:hypothetical protein
MIPDNSAAQLLDAAVPPIPPSLRTPPIERIRHRARRRRLATTGSAVGAAVVLVAAGFVVLSSVEDRRSTVVGRPSPDNVADVPEAPEAPEVPATAPPVPGAPADSVSWEVVRVDRTGLQMVAYVNPSSLRNCMGFPSPQANVDEAASVVTILLTAKPGRMDCSRTMATPVHITLSRPLGDRTLRDGRTGLDAIAFQDRYLPVVGAPWFEVPASFTFVHGGLTVGYTRPGGPDLQFTVQVGTASATGTAVTLGSRQGVLVDGPQPGVQWQVGDLVYSMLLEPTEGATSSVDQVRSVIGQLTWP